MQFLIDFQWFKSRKMSQKVAKNGEKPADNNKFTKEEQAKLKEYYDGLAKTLELG